MPVNILLNGAKGRMGQAIIAIAESEDANVVAKIDIGDDPAKTICDCDVVIDFSFHEITLSIASLCESCNKPLIIGTTGHSTSDREAITEIAKKIPIVWAGNYSVGVNLLNYLTRKATQILSTDYNPEVIEMHHCHKKDAPSGTAERLIEIIRETRNLTPEHEQHGRKGIVGERPTDEIGIHAIRGGDIVGEHTVLFAGDGERIELTHRAGDRKIFAKGAVRAAHWVLKQQAGLYNMEDVLGLRD